jgi:hypothetical protein
LKILEINSISEGIGNYDFIRIRLSYFCETTHYFFELENFEKQSTHDIDKQYEHDIRENDLTIDNTNSKSSVFELVFSPHTRFVLTALVDTVLFGAPISIAMTVIRYKETRMSEDCFYDSLALVYNRPPLMQLRQLYAPCQMISSRRMLSRSPPYDLTEYRCWDQTTSGRRSSLFTKIPCQTS